MKDARLFCTEITVELAGLEAQVVIGIEIYDQTLG
jgi:hypothetical protein